MRLLLFKHKETKVKYIMFKDSVYTWQSLQRDYPLLQECEFLEDAIAEFSSPYFPLDKLLVEVMEVECHEDKELERVPFVEDKKKKTKQ